MDAQSGAVLRRMMETLGYRLERISGSHHIFVKPGRDPESIPVHGGKVKFNYVRNIKKLAAEQRQGD